MIDYKGLKMLFSQEQITTLIKYFGEKLIIIGARTSNGKIHAIRGAIINGKTAIDIFAVANQYARKHYFSYALCWELISRCIKKMFDLRF